MNNLLNKIVNIITNEYHNDITNKILEIYNILYTREEKIILFLLTNIVYNINLTFTCDYNEMNSLINKNINELLQLINWNTLVNATENNFRNQIFKILIQNNHIRNYLNKYDYLNLKLIYFTRFYYKTTYNNMIQFNNIIKVNKFLHYLRMYVKKKINLKIKKYKLKMFHVHNDIIKNKKLLFHEFNSYEISYITKKINYDNNYYLLRENIIGLKINNLPNNIFPYNKIFNEFTVQCVYVEKIDLYLIYDINISDSVITDRYKLLKKIHNNLIEDIEINEINSISEYQNLLQKDFIDLNNFIINNSNKIKWYPVFCCQYLNNNDNFINEIYNFRNLNKNSLYDIDGIRFNKLKRLNFNNNNEFVISNPLNVNLYLKYKNKKWLDYNNNNWNKFINFNTLNNFTIKNNNIYKFNYLDNKLHIIEYVYYKNIPDSYIKINSIIKIN